MAAKRGEMTGSARDGRKFLNDVAYEAVESTRRDLYCVAIGADFMTILEYRGIAVLGGPLRLGGPVGGTPDPRRFGNCHRHWPKPRSVDVLGVVANNRHICLGNLNWAGSKTCDRVQFPALASPVSAGWSRTGGLPKCGMKWWVGGPMHAQCLDLGVKLLHDFLDKLW